MTVEPRAGERALGPRKRDYYHYPAPSCRPLERRFLGLRYNVRRPGPVTPSLLPEGRGNILPRWVKPRGVFPTPPASFRVGPDPMRRCPPERQRSSEVDLPPIRLLQPIRARGARIPTIPAMVLRVLGCKRGRSWRERIAAPSTSPLPARTVVGVSVDSHQLQRYATGRAR